MTAYYIVNMETNFKEGDWIVRIDGSDIVPKVRTMLVRKIDTDCVHCEYETSTKFVYGYLIPNISLNNFRLWNINDAKRGDFLLDKENFTAVIFDELFEDSFKVFCLVIYGCIGRCNRVHVEHFKLNPEKVRSYTPIPAWYNIVDYALEDEGYKWDKDKNELIKI